MAAAGLGGLFVRVMSGLFEYTTSGALLSLLGDPPRPTGGAAAFVYTGADVYAGVGEYAGAGDGEYCPCCMGDCLC